MGGQSLLMTSVSENYIGYNQLEKWIKEGINSLDWSWKEFQKFKNIIRDIKKKRLVKDDRR